MSEYPENASEQEKKGGLDPALPEKALKNFRALVKGNGLKPESLSLQEFDGVLLDFEAYGIFKIKTSISEKRVSGREQGETATSVTDARQKINTYIEYVTQNKDVRKFTVNMLKKRPDLGFGINNQIINLKQMNKRFVIHDVCGPCQSTGKVLCQHCRGKKRISCVKCQGQGDIQCPLCNGAQFINTQQNRQQEHQQCTQCHGRGRISCDFCRQTGEVSCPKCKSTGQMSCSDCSSSGWNSHIFHISVHAESHFDYDRQSLPEDVPALIDEYGPRLLTENHAQIRIIENVSKEEEINKRSKADEYMVPYYVNMPWGAITFSVKGKPVKGTLFGFNPALKDMPPLLEKTMGKGLRLLSRAAQGQGKVAEDISTAIRTRAIGEAFLAALPNPPKRALAIMQKRYPYALQETSLEKMVGQAGKAIKHLTKKPRLTGLAIGAILSIFLYALYFIGPLRHIFVMKTASVFPATIPDIIPDIVPDTGSILITGALITASIEITVAKALQQALGEILNKENKSGLMPKLFKSALWGYPAALILFAVILVLAIMSGRTPPEWLF